jgi:hypothetical protein
MIFDELYRTLYKKEKMCYNSPVIRPLKTLDSFEAAMRLQSTIYSFVAASKEEASQYILRKTRDQERGVAAMSVLLNKVVPISARKWGEVARQLEEKFQIGNPEVQALLDANRIADLAAVFNGTKMVQDFDILAPFRKIRGLIVIGSKEWEKALRFNGKDPMGLGQNWCLRNFSLVTDTPNGPVELTPELMIKLVKLCQTPEWNCTPVLELELMEVGGKPTSLETQYSLWGVGHDGRGPGSVRQDTMWSNWFIGKHDWAKESATVKVVLKVKYLDFPAWSTMKNWNDQQKAAEERGLTIASAPSDALTMNLVAIAKGKRFRETTYARTCTIYARSPLHVDFSDSSLRVIDDWSPESVDSAVVAAVEGVPLELL